MHVSVLHLFSVECTWVIGYEIVISHDIDGEVGATEPFTLMNHSQLC